MYVFDVCFDEIGIILIAMLAMHFIADAGGVVLHEYKKISRWSEFKGGKKHLWIPPLLAHSFIWAFLINLPFIYFCGTLNVFALFINMGIHFVVDFLFDRFLKNKIQYRILDQIIHIAQVVITWLLLMAMYILCDTVVCVG